jgi:hypothetical protein
MRPMVLPSRSTVKVPLADPRRPRHEGQDGTHVAARWLAGRDDHRSFQLSRDLLRGAIDIHVHAGPHIFSSPRRVDPFEAAIEARDAGMRAIVYMDVFEMSNGTAWLVNRQVPDFTTYGGLILNTVYGGMNPRAVKTALTTATAPSTSPSAPTRPTTRPPARATWWTGASCRSASSTRSSSRGGAGPLHPHPARRDPGPELDEILS